MKLLTVGLMSVAMGTVSLSTLALAQTTEPTPVMEPAEPAPPMEPAEPAPMMDAEAPAEPMQMAEPAAPMAPMEPKPECELHVFPTLEGTAQTTGWLSGFGIVGALADASANAGKNQSEGDYLREALGPDMQVKALKTIDLVSVMKLPPSQIIYEEPIADRKIYTKAKTRLSSSTAPCYVELIMTQNFYKKAAIYGRSLNNRYVVKDFRSGKTETKLIKGRGGNGLKDFPPKTPEETEAAEADLQRAFIANFLEFAKGLKL